MKKFEEWVFEVNFGDAELLKKHSPYMKLAYDAALEISAQSSTSKCKKKSIYDLDLHDALTLDNGILIMRVPGGWIYDCWDFSNDCSKRGTFVRFDNEYQPRK